MNYLVGRRLTKDRLRGDFERISTSFQTHRVAANHPTRARIGDLWVHGTRVSTPYLFPVLNILTGPPWLERNGATHKFLKSYLFFEQRRQGLMTEVLHFTDYPFTPRNFYEWFPHARGSGEVHDLTYWVNHGFERRGEEDRKYQPLFFLDSGGFRLLFNRDVDISEYGYAATQESILKLQLAYGASIIASLDYPVPPSLAAKEAVERIEKSIANAVLLMDLLYKQDKRDSRGNKPFPVLAVHGQTPDQIQHCITSLLRRLDQQDLIEKPFGIGIGSLVPLRLRDASKVVTIVQSAVSALYSSDVPSRFDPSTTPIHAFGITGDMIPVLTYLGVDTFDSSSYIKSASVLDYYAPQTWSPINFHKLESLTCNCNICKDIQPSELAQLQEVLRGAKITGKKERLGMKIGSHTVNIKSDVYGLIAAHNLNLQDQAITQVNQAIEVDVMSEYLVRFGHAHPRSQPLVELIAQSDPAVAAQFSHFQIALLPSTRHESIENSRTISLNYNPQSFDVQTKNYYPNGMADRLLLLACSKTKPYRNSKSHATIAQFLEGQVGEAYKRCHKVTLSGMYGPIPLEFEDDLAVLQYEYILGSGAKKQIALITERLVVYLLEHAEKYQRIVAYVTAAAYRKVVEDAFSIIRARMQADGVPPALINERFVITPSISHGGGTKELLQHVHLRELLSKLYPDVPHTGLSQSTLDLDK